MGNHRQLATRFSVDAAVSILCYRSWDLWFLGYPEAALADSDYAISYAREIGQAATLMYALGHTPFTYFECGDCAKAKAVVDELVALANEKGALFWQAYGMMNEGWLFALTGKAADAVDKITSGLTAWRSTGSGVWIPLYLSCATGAYAAIGRYDDARRWTSPEAPVSPASPGSVFHRRFVPVVASLIGATRDQTGPLRPRQGSGPGSRPAATSASRSI
jgi:hypothetical protein